MNKNKERWIKKCNTNWKLKEIKKINIWKIQN